MGCREDNGSTYGLAGEAKLGYRLGSLVPPIDWLEKQTFAIAEVRMVILFIAAYIAIA